MLRNVVTYVCDFVGGGGNVKKKNNHREQDYAISNQHLGMQIRRNMICFYEKARVIIVFCRINWWWSCISITKWIETNMYMYAGMLLRRNRNVFGCRNHNYLSGFC